MPSINDTFKNDAKNYKNNLNSTTKEQTSEEREYEYVMLLRSTFDRSLFPNDFDKWTVKKQYNWINKNLSKFYPNVPESLLELIPASFHEENCDRSLVEKPEWLDMDKYRKGQKFVQEYFVGVTMSIILSLLHIYSFENNLRPIILSGRTHTPYLGFKRYLSTMCRMMNWFDGEPWIEGTPAYKDMQVVRKIHAMMRKRLSLLSNDKIDAACTLENPWCPDRELLLKDFAAACPFEKIGQRPYESFAKLPYKRTYINNADMAIIQCCFVGLILLYPREFGVHNATDKDLEAFCHIWKCYGYYLGMEDEYVLLQHSFATQSKAYNFCRGSLEEIKQRARDLYQYWVMPNLKNVTSEWEHMTRCVVEPFNYFPLMYMSYKSAVLLATDIFSINMSHLYSSLSYLDWIVYNGWRFVLRHALKLSSIRSFFNQVLRKTLNQMINCDPEKERQIHKQSVKQVKDFTITC